MTLQSSTSRQHHAPRSSSRCYVRCSGVEFNLQVVADVDSNGRQADIVLVCNTVLRHGLLQG